MIALSFRSAGPAVAVPRWLAIVTLLAAGAGQAAAATSQATLGVSVTVARQVSMRVAPPASIIVSPTDAARGYLEIEEPLELRVRSNVQQGYTLFFERHGVHVLKAHVLNSEGEFLVDQGAAALWRPAAGPGRWSDLLRLRFRFHLAPGVAPGEYPWPLHISMSAP